MTLEVATVWRNWARSVKVLPEFVARPTSVDEVVSVVREARDRGLRVKAVGSGHSFNGIAIATGIQVDLSRLTGLVAIDEATARATIAAGTRLHDVPALIGPYGLALENLGDVDSQTISGATSTGTHGTGAAFGGIATRIVGTTLVTADATVLRITEGENAELLPAAALGLGALGIVVDLTVQCVPAFLLNAVERPEPLDAVLDSFEERADAVDHFEAYWFPHTNVALTKTNTRLPADAAPRPLGTVRRWVDDSVMSNSVFRVSCGVSRFAPFLTPSINRLSTRLTGDREFTDAPAAVFTTQRSVRFREMEYALPHAAVPQALRDIHAVIESNGWTVSFPLEVRVAASDDLWLSTAHDRQTGYIAVHRYYREDPLEYFSAVEQICLSHGGRPHWGKMHFQGAEYLAEAYPHHADFVAVRDRLDPERMFTNTYLERVLGE